MFVTIIDVVNRAATWLRQEQQRTWGWLYTPGLVVSILFAALLAILAYQYTPAFVLAIGGDTLAHLREYDTPFLHGFNASEPAPKDQEWWALAERPYRWSTPEADIHLPAIGGQHWQLVLTLASGRPDNSQVLVEITTGTGIAQQVIVAPGIRRYRLLGNTQNGNLLTTIHTDPFTAPNDSRELGVVAYSLVATPLDSLPQLPVLSQLLFHVILAALGYGITQRLGLGNRIALLMGIVSGFTLAGLLIYDRLGLAIATPRLALIAVACLLLVPILEGFLDVVLRQFRMDIAHGERGAALGSVLLAFWVRMAGITHPYAQFSDLRFNANNLLRVIRGELLLVAGLPCDAGAGNAPYPPAQYLTIAPLQLLFADTSRSANEQIIQIIYLIQGSVALFESIGAAILWLLLRRLGLGRNAALLAAFLYILPVPLLRAYSVGEMANLFGQALVPYVLLLLALWPSQTNVGRTAILAAMLLALLMLSHTGVTISAICLVGAWLVIQIVQKQGAQLAPFTIVLAVAGIIAISFFYSAYMYVPQQNQLIRAELATRTPSLICPPGRALGDKLLATLALGFGSGGTLSVPLVIAAATALFGAHQKAQLRIMLVAAVLGTLGSFGTLLNSDQPVRWAHFLFPTICLAAGVSLAVWARRGKAGMTLMLTLLTAILWFAASDWVRQISRYLH